MNSEFGYDANPKAIRAGIHPERRAARAFASGKAKVSMFLCLIAAFFSTTTLAGGLPQAKDLRADALRAERGHVPVMLFFSATTCSYCKEVEELYLMPMYADASQRSKVIIRQVQIDSGVKLRDFSGRMIDAAKLAQHYGVTLTPTIKLVDASGRELVPALVGLSSPDFYGDYLDTAISQAGVKMRQGSTRHSARRAQRHSPGESASVTNAAPSVSPTRRGAG